MMKFDWKKFAIEATKALCTAILAALGAMSMSGCGVTKASITNRASGTQTTITITTNNPMNTSVSPTTEVSDNLNKKGE